MTTILHGSVSIALLGLISLWSPVILAAPPSGTLRAGCGPVWDVSGDYPVSVTIDDDIEVSFGISVQQDARGKLSGAGTTTVTIDSDTVQGNYTVKGTVSSTHDGVDSSISSVSRVTVTIRVSGTGVIGGITRRFSLLVTYRLLIDRVTLIASGTGKGYATATGLGTGRINDAASIALPPGMNGQCQLQADIVVAGNKVTGTATAQLSNGRTVEFTVTGMYSPRTDITKLKLTGTGTSTGSNLRWDGKDEQFGYGVVTGKILGQSTRVPE